MSELGDLLERLVSFSVINFQVLNVTQESVLIKIIKLLNFPSYCLKNTLKYF
jgi:hypothetical protein